MKHWALRALVFLAVLAAFPNLLAADTVLSDVTHNYGGLITIRAVVTDQGSNYLWEYTVTNDSYNPAGGNGFSGFELALPAFVPDIGNITNPVGWDVNCCSGLPVEWDIDNAPGILVGETAVFSFTTDPRLITNSTGWFHSWDSTPVQIDIRNYSDFSCSAIAFVPCVGPEAPFIATAEPGSLPLLAGGLFGVVFWVRRRFPF